MVNPYLVPGFPLSHNGVVYSSDWFVFVIGVVLSLCCYLNLFGYLPVSARVISSLALIVKATGLNDTFAFSSKRLLQLTWIDLEQLNLNSVQLRLHPVLVG